MSGNKNAAISWPRSSQRKTGFCIPIKAPNPGTLRQQDSEQLAAAVQALPEDYARVVMLRDMEGLSYRDVAEILAIPRGTVMSRLSRGRRLLAKTLLNKARQDGHTDSIRIHPGKER